MKQVKPHTRQDGVISVLAMIFLATFAALGIAYAAAANNSMLQADNLSNIQNSHLQAESGLEYFTHLLKQVQVPPGLSGQELLAAVEAALAAPLNSEITTGETGRGFTAALAVDGNTVTLTANGRSGTIQRAISMDFALVPAGSVIFGYGVASMGRIKMTGNAWIRGVSSSTEANIFSGTYATDQAYKLTGHSLIEGDIYTANPDAYATLAGNASVGGESVDSDEIHDHIHIGMGDQPFPEVNSAVFEPFAINIVDADTPINDSSTFSNIRILADVNPTFSGDTTLDGVIFIEQPNNVHFTGNTIVTGVIVTQDAGDGAYDTNEIKFTGNSTVHGVEELPDLLKYAEIKLMPGSFLLAPGFGVEFAGNFGIVSGTMAADRFKFTGDAGGIIKGSIICYSDEELMLAGDSNLTFDHSSKPSIPSGFSTPDTLAPIPTSYTEH